MNKKEPHIFTASEFFQLTSEILGIQTSQNEKMTYARAFDTKSDRFAGKKVDDEEKSDGICEKIIQTLLGEDCFLKNEQVNLNICREILHAYVDTYEEYFGLLQSSLVYQNTDTQSLNKTLIRLLLAPQLASFFLELQDGFPKSCSLTYLMTCINNIYETKDEDIVVACKKTLRDKIKALSKLTPMKRLVQEPNIFKNIRAMDDRSASSPSTIKASIIDLKEQLELSKIQHYSKIALGELRGLYNCFMILMQMKRKMGADTFSLFIRIFTSHVLLLERSPNENQNLIIRTETKKQPFLLLQLRINQLNQELLLCLREDYRNEKLRINGDPDHITGVDGKKIFDLSNYFKVKEKLEKQKLSLFRRILSLSAEFNPNQESKELIDYLSRGLAVIGFNDEPTDEQELQNLIRYFNRLIQELRTLEHLNYTQPIKAFTQCILAMIEDQHEESLRYIDIAYEVHQNGHIGLFIGLINQFKLCLMLSKNMKQTPNTIDSYITGLSSSSIISRDIIAEGLPEPSEVDSDQFLTTAHYGLIKMIANHNEFCTNLEVNPNQFIVNPLTKLEKFFDSFFYKVDQSKEIDFERKVKSVCNKFTKSSLNKYKVYHLNTPLIEWMKPEFPIVFGIQSEFKYKGEIICINPNIWRYCSLKRSDKQIIINMLESIYSS